MWCEHELIWKHKNYNYISRNCWHSIIQEGIIRSLVPRPPPFFVLRLAFSIIHESGRARKRGRHRVGLKPGTRNEETRNEEMEKWGNEQMMWAKLSRRPARETMVYLTERAVGWQDKEGRQIMGVTPAVRGLIALTVTSSEFTEPMERVWKVLIKGGKCTRCAYVMDYPCLRLITLLLWLWLGDAGDRELRDSPITAGALSHKVKRGYSERNL